MNRQEIRYAALNKLGVPETQRDDPRFWSTSELNDMINECNRDLVKKTEYYRKNNTVIVADEQTYFDLPDDCFKVLRVTHDGEKLRPSSTAELDDLDLNWRDDAESDPIYYFIDVLQPGKLGVYPRPTDTGGTYDYSQEYGIINVLAETGTTFTFSGEYGAIVNMKNDEDYEFNQDEGVCVRITTTSDNLKIDYVAIPPELTEDTESPAINEVYHDAYVYYLVKEALLKYNDRKDQSKIGMYEMKYNNIVAEAAEQYKNNTTPAKERRIRSTKRTGVPEPRFPQDREVTYP